MFDKNKLLSHYSAVTSIHPKDVLLFHLVLLQLYPSCTVYVKSIPMKHLSACHSCIFKISKFTSYLQPVSGFLKKSKYCSFTYLLFRNEYSYFWWKLNKYKYEKHALKRNINGKRLTKHAFSKI